MFVFIAMENTKFLICWQVFETLIKILGIIKVRNQLVIKINHLILAVYSHLSLPLCS